MKVIFFIIGIIIFISLATMLLMNYKKQVEVKTGGAIINKHVCLGSKLHEYVLKLKPPKRHFRHHLTNTTYAYHGGAKNHNNVKTKWYDYDTWEELENDEDASAEYFKQRSEVLENPNLDWSLVLADMLPKLEENKEYIGIANLINDKLRIVASEASPLIAGESNSETTFAGVPGDLVAKYASRPGLILFHTHPADIRGSPLPSSHDLSTAIYFGATSRFAACAVISRYGVIMHGLDWSAYKAINEAKDWKLATLNISHDIVAAHEAIRSWSPYTNADYLAFYPRHQMLLFVYPSAEMVGDSRKTYSWNIEHPIDHGLIMEHGQDILDHRSSTKNSKSATFSNELSNIISLGFD